jgi:hypothetical protein
MAERQSCGRIKTAGFKQVYAISSRDIARAATKFLQKDLTPAQTV